MRSSSRLCDLLQRRLDGGGDLGLARLALRRRDRETRIEARMEQRDDLDSDRRLLHQRRPHIILRIGHADLPQKARDGADQRHVAPPHAGRQHQRVVAVVLGAAAHHHQEGGFEAAAWWRRDRSRDRPRARAACRGARRPRSPAPPLRHRGRSDRCARRRRGSPCSRAPARARTAGSAGRGSRPSARRRRADRRRDDESRRRAGGSATDPR